MTTFNTSTEASRCPRCGADNRCAIAQGDPPASCWCFTVTIDHSSTAPYRELERCLCQQCCAIPIEPGLAESIDLKD